MKVRTWGSLVGAVLLLAGGGVGLSGCKRGDKGEHAGKSIKANFHCPMHSTYVSDRAGDCPICGMRLVPIKSDDAEKGGERKPLFYRHPMRPDVTSHDPQKDDMGMDYVPVYAGEINNDGNSIGRIADRAPVSLSQERQQLIGVRTTLVARRDLEILVRCSGRVAYDPDLYNAIVEHREALKAKENVKESPWPDVRDRADALVQSSRLRLRQTGLSEEQINRLRSTTENPTNLLLSEKGGSVWVYAQIYENEAGIIKPGQIMDIASAAFPDLRLKGRVVAVDTNLNPDTRTLRVRGEIQNPEGLLRSEMYVDATIHVALGRKLAIPEDAVLDTGSRRIIFVETRAGHYEPREVALGRQAEGYREVLSGVVEGERVVTSANFLIDSESRLKAAISSNGSGD